MSKTWNEVIGETKREITEITPEDADKRLGAGESVFLLDVRESDEFRQGHLPGATHIARSFLEMKIEGESPDRDRPIIVYCAGGTRSALAAKTLKEMGYRSVASMSGGFAEWKRQGRKFDVPFQFKPEQLERYDRHFRIPEVGEAGQAKLLQSRVLMIGAGGLGSPAALYLAAAGVGTMGIVEFDVVDRSNLQRQIVHSEPTVGTPKAQSARDTLTKLNPDVDVVLYEEMLSSANIMRIIEDRDYQIIVDGTDNFATRYLINDACVWKNIPNVHGSIFRFDGQVTVFHPGVGPCYRCLYPEPPPPELAPSCAEAGVLGILPGVIGVLQAVETVKLILGKGESLAGRMLVYDSLGAHFSELKLYKDPKCPVCGPNPTITEFIDYVEFCNVGRG
ncbi:MAG: molybdopterin-synthase adenylyltransferase MoeB [Myxococcales bacterium]|nr:molybdopterin-synthase adenylyltransferase MoeB [Myxococcales bacterium]